MHVVAPSAWAWRGGERRLPALRAAVDLLLCILPFEPPLLHAAGVPAAFIGHPVLDDCDWDATAGWHLRRDRDAAASARVAAVRAAESRGGDSGRAAAAAVAAGAPLLCVLPGSRAQELNAHLALFGAALRVLSAQRAAGAAVPAAALVPTLPAMRERVAAAVADWPLPVALVDGSSPAARCAPSPLAGAGLP